MSNRSASPFQVLGTEQRAGRETSASAPQSSASLNQNVEAMVRSADVFLLMKGSPQRPMCGFSANTVSILNTVGCHYRTFDVLSDERVRAAAKETARWPTFPQLWVRGEFVGGNDIVTEMYQSGELKELLEEGGA